MKTSFTEDLFTRTVTVQAIKTTGRSSRGVRGVQLTITDAEADTTRKASIVLTDADWRRVATLLKAARKFDPEP